MIVIFFVANFSGSNTSPPSDDGVSQNIIKSSQEDDQASTSVENETEVALTLEEVAKHSTKEDCWFVIRTKVYDVSVSKFQDHPGGDAIYQGCGIDATTLFESRTTSSGEKVGSGTPHSEGAQEKLLPLFYIGDLVE